MTARRWLLGSGLAAWIACVLACGGAAPLQPRGGTASDAPPAASAEDMAKWKKVIQDLCNEGFFEKVEYGDKPSVWVTPEFMTLDYADKKKGIAIVAAYAFKVPAGGELRAGENVYLVSNKTGNIVGTYSSLGLQLD